MGMGMGRGKQIKQNPQTSFSIFFAPQQGILTDAGDGEGGIIKKERTISKTIYFYYIIYFR